MTVCGCEVTKVKRVPHNDEGYFVKQAFRAAEQDRDGLWSDQFENPHNPEGHYLETGLEIIEQMEGDLDVFVMGAGTGATLNGISHRFKKDLKNLKRIPKIVLSDPQGPSVLYNWVKNRNLENDGAGKTKVEGIGLDYLCKNFDPTLIDDAEKITDAEALLIGFYMIRHEGLLVGSTTAVNIATIIKQIKRYNLKGKRLLTIACDDGFRHISKFYNKEKWEGVNFKELQEKVSNMMDLSFIEP